VSFGISLLIAADYYWMTVEDTVVRGPGPTAVASKLGYILFQPTNMKNTPWHVTNADDLLAKY